MKKRSVLHIGVSLSLLIFQVTFAGCNKSTEETPTPDSNIPAAGTAAAADLSAPATSPPLSGGGIIVTVPEGWTKVTPSSVPAQYMKGTSTFIAKTEPIPGTDLDAIAAQAMGMFQKTFTDVVVVGETVKLLVDGKEARKIVFTCKISNMNMKYIYVYLKVGGQTWALTFGGLVDTFDSLSADYQLILNGIRFQ